MGGGSKGFHLKGKIYEQDVNPWCIQGRLKLLHFIVIKSDLSCSHVV